MRFRLVGRGRRSGVMHFRGINTELAQPVFRGGRNAPYIWVAVPSGYSSWQVFDKMLRDIQVVITPGVGFGAQGEGYFRVSAFNSRENAREVARRFNHFYQLNGKDVLPEPQVLLTPSPKLPGTDGRKMSKSYGNTIMISDPEAEVRKKLKGMVTDPARVRRTDPGDPDKCPVGDLHKVFSSAETLAKVYEGCRSAGIGCIECKGWAADALVQVLNPIQERRASFTPVKVKEILDDGNMRAAARAEQTMEEVRAAMKLAPAPARG